MPSLFRRRTPELITDAVEDASAESAATRRGYTPKKGEVTPKRPSVNRRVEPPPANRKEALARSRDKQRQARAEQRAGMIAGDERYLLPRDKGPVRGLVRDIVDARRNATGWFFIVLFMILLLSNRAMPVIVQVVSNLLFLAAIIMLLLDSVLLCRKVKKVVLERHPETTERWGSLYFYAIMRALSPIRRMRMPKPRIKVGGTY